jgi:F420-dependent oxidoreductase-like protein
VRGNCFHAAIVQKGRKICILALMTERIIIVTQEDVRQSSSVRRSARERTGFIVASKNTVDAIERIREAEQAGVRQIWMSIGGSGASDLLTMFAAAAVQTSRIRMGTDIVPIYPRHPLVMAQQALTVNDIAPGRLLLGIGPSHKHIIEGSYGLAHTSPLAYLREYVEVTRSVLWEGKVDYHGTFFNVKASLPRTAQIPLLVSALGVKAFRLAGEISDGALSWFCPAPYLLDRALSELRAGAEARKRPAPPLIAHVPIALSADKAAAQAAARRTLSPYTHYPFYAHMFAEAGAPVAEDGSGIDKLIEMLVITGDEATVRDRIAQLLASELDELQLYLLPVADEASERKQLLSIIGSLPDA